MVEGVTSSDYTLGILFWCVVQSTSTASPPTIKVWCAFVCFICMLICLYYLMLLVVTRVFCRFGGVRIGQSVRQRQLYSTLVVFNLTICRADTARITECEVWR